MCLATPFKDVRIVARALTYLRVVLGLVLSLCVKTDHPTWTTTLQPPVWCVEMAPSCRQTAAAPVTGISAQTGQQILIIPRSLLVSTAVQDNSRLPAGRALVWTARVVVSRFLGSVRV